MGLKTVRVPPELLPLFERAEEVVAAFFGRRVDTPERGSIEICGERYILHGTCSVSIDRARIAQVLINVIDNAIAHSPPGGTVTVRHACSNGMARVEIDDDGAGIPPSDMPHLFEPFFSKRRGGTGLGLSIVQRIVTQHGGRVVAENREARGARLTVHLPIGLAADHEG
jgi:signal transduction histidine kinase